MVVRALEPGEPRGAGPYRFTVAAGRRPAGNVYRGEAKSAHVLAQVIDEAAAGGDFRHRLRQDLGVRRSFTHLWYEGVWNADPDAHPPWVAVRETVGYPLDEAVDRFGPLPLPTMAMLGLALVDVLSALHDLGLSHGEVTPSAVILSADGPRLVDFGTAPAYAALRETPDEARAEDIRGLLAVLTSAMGGTAPESGPAAPVRLRASASASDSASDSGAGPPSFGEIREALSALVARGGAHGPAAPRMDRLASTARSETCGPGDKTHTK